MLVYRDGFENEICCKGDQGNDMPDQVWLPFLDAVKQYFTTVYLFFRTLFCIRLLCFWIYILNSCFGFLVFVMVWGGPGLSGGWGWVNRFTSAFG